MMITLRSIRQGVLATLPSPLSALVQRGTSALLTPFKPRSIAPAPPISEAITPSIAPPQTISDEITQSTPSKTEPSMPDGTDPFDFVSSEAMTQIFHNLSAYPHQLLQVSEVRQVLARERAKHFMEHGDIKRLENSSDAVASFTLQRNIDAAKTAADFDRPSLMAHAASALERVRQDAAHMDVLSIGPRSEIEIFALLAAGFSKAKIRAVDLFSYSPLVGLGDMHALPFPDNSFDIVFIGWVMTYSRDHLLVAREILRVCRDKAIVVLAGDYCDDSIDDPAFRNKRMYMKSCDQLLSLFEGYVGRVYFRHEPDPPKVWMVMTVFEVAKPAT
jgi:SAM-dependent methyltransferase